MDDQAYNQQSPNLRRNIILVLIALLVVGLIYTLSSFAFINIQVENPNGEYTYTLIKQSDQKTAVSKNSTGSFKKFVTRGNYEVLVQKGETSYYSVVNSGGFMLTRKVSASLSDEKERAFIGESPQPCMNMVVDVLVSYECNNLYDRLKMHVPATSTFSTYVKNNPQGFTRNVEQILNIQGKSYIMTKSLETIGDSAHNLYPVTDIQDILKLPLAQKTTLYSLSNNQDYSAKPFGKGFLAYANDFSSINKYDSPESTNANPVQISAPKDTKLKPYALNTSGSTITLVYSNNTELEKSAAEINHRTQDPPKQSGLVSEVVVYENEQSKHFTFNKFIINANTCGTNKLCIQAADSASIYDISGKKAKHLFDVTSIDFMNTVNNNLIVGRKGYGVLAVDVDKRAGSLEYSYGNYSQCGTQTVENNYLLCVINNQTRQMSALLISRNVQNSNNIDKRVAELQKSPPVSYISAYKNFIYIVPNYGELKYQYKLGRYGYDPDVVKRMNEELPIRIKESGIDTSKYQITISASK